MRLEAAHEATQLIRFAYGRDTAQAWLFGTNSALDDQAPATALREAVAPEDASIVVRLARELVGRNH